MIEAMKRAYADRAEFLGDPDAVDMPVARLTSKDYAAALRAGIDPDRTRPAGAIRAGKPEGDNTTHLSIVDRFGNAVANTYTINLSYGVGLVADGTGVLLNNELDDFAAKPGAPNAFGLAGGAANAPGPANGRRQCRRPSCFRTASRSSSPARRRQPHHHHGAAGDRQRDRPRHGAAAGRRGPAHPSSVAARRGRAERGIAAETAALAARGHKVASWGLMTSANSIMVTRDGLVGAADPRTRGALAAGH